MNRTQVSKGIPPSKDMGNGRAKSHFIVKSSPQHDFTEFSVEICKSYRMFKSRTIYKLVGTKRSSRHNLLILWQEASEWVPVASASMVSNPAQFPFGTHLILHFEA